jgi:hypothetical protein
VPGVIRFSNLERKEDTGFCTVSARSNNNYRDLLTMEVESGPSPLCLSMLASCLDTTWTEHR